MLKRPESATGCRTIEGEEEERKEFTHTITIE
jgi:hypothetical protein